MSDQQEQQPGTSTTVSTASSSTPNSNKMGIENKLLSSSSREMRNMAEKMRRDKLNNYVAEIAGIVPLGSGTNKRVDKTSVLRLAANYIRMHKILKDDEDDSVNKVPLNMGKEITHSLAEAVGGFLLVVTSSGKVVYITEAVDQFFGHTQVDLLGHSIYSVIHPDDHEIFQQQLVPKDNSRRSFFCRMMEKALSRNDPGRYEIIHVVGQLKPLPQVQAPSHSTCYVPSPAASSPGESSLSSDHDDEESSDNEGEMRPLKITNRTGTHMLVSFVRIVKDRPITELSLVESTQDEYITRHGMDGKILYTDHRISCVTGLMPSEVIGTSAFNYMHGDDILWSIVAQKLMFTSTQGQGIVSYRLKCRDGAHITLRSRGFLEVNKQTGQVDSFVCINTVLNMKEASSEIKNQRRKLLPVIACNETEDHLGSISSSLPPELMMMIKQVMNPEMIQKMIESVKESDSLLQIESREAPEVSMDVGASLTHSPENTDLMKNRNCDHADQPFQTKPKRAYSQVSNFRSLPEACVVDVEKDQLHRISRKRSGIEDYSIVANKKITFEKNLPCPDLLHPNYRASSMCCQQLSPRTVSPQTNLFPATSLVPENNTNYPSGTYQKYSNRLYSSDDGNQAVSCNVINPSISPQFQNTGAEPPGNHCQQESQSTLPLQRQDGHHSVTASKKRKCNINQNLPSPNYSRRVAAFTTTASPSYNQSEDEETLSPGYCEPRVTDCETPYAVVCHQRICESLPSPGSSNHQSRVRAQCTDNSLQNRCDDMHSLGTHRHIAPSYHQSSDTDVPSPGSYNQIVHQRLTSVQDCSHSDTRPVLPTQDNYQSKSKSISCNVGPHCSYQSNIPMPKDQSRTASQHQNQLFPEYHQASSSASYPLTGPQYLHPISAQAQRFTVSHGDSSDTSPEHYSEFPPQLQKTSSPNARQVPSNQDSGCHDVSLYTSDQSIPFGETETSGKL